jgi:hypothetical protein
LPLNGEPLRIFIGEQNRWMSDRDAWMYCNELAAFACAHLTSHGRVYVAGQPSRLSPIVTIGGPPSTPAAAVAEGLDTTDRYLPRARPPLMGTKYGWEYDTFHKQGAEDAFSYDTIKFPEFRWGIGRVNRRTGEFTPVSQPDIYRPGDTDDERDVGFVKEGDLLLAAVVPNRAAPLITIAGAHPGDTAQWPSLLGDPEFNKRAELATRNKRTGFQMHIHFTRVTPNHDQEIMEIPDNEWHIVDVAPLTDIDEGLLKYYADRSSSPPRALSRDGRRDRVLWCRGIDFRKVGNHD